MGLVRVRFLSLFSERIDFFTCYCYPFWVPWYREHGVHFWIYFKVLGVCVFFCFGIANVHMTGFGCVFIARPFDRQIVCVAITCIAHQEEKKIVHPTPNAKEMKNQSIENGSRWTKASRQTKSETFIAAKRTFIANFNSPLDFAVFAFVSPNN